MYFKIYWKDKKLFRLNVWSNDSKYLHEANKTVGRKVKDNGNKEIFTQVRFKN